MHVTTMALVVISLTVLVYSIYVLAYHMPKTVDPLYVHMRQFIRVSDTVAAVHLRRDWYVENLTDNFNMQCFNVFVDPRRYLKGRYRCKFLEWEKVYYGSDGQVSKVDV